MAYACVDVGSNTTRLLVAEVRDGKLRELLTRRVFTRLGRCLTTDRLIPPEKVSEAVEVVSTQLGLAIEMDVREVAIVATAAIRESANGGELVDAIAERCGRPVTVLTDREEARLAFLGAMKTLDAPVDGRVAVVDVGGGSSEVSVGTASTGFEWFASFRVGSGSLADAHLRSDPPTAEELAELRRHAAGAFEDLGAPSADAAVAVGGSASSLRRLVGSELSHEALERAIALLASSPSDEIASRFELDPQRVRLLPAGVVLLDELGNRVGVPMTAGRGGVREGAILELAEKA